MVDEALNLFKDMRCRKTIPYNCLIDGLCKLGRISYAFELVDEMHDREQPPDIFTYEIIIRSLFDKGENDKAEKLLRQMIVRGVLYD
ncbi:pentatricopeptide repeat-containing protein [Trifolium medium]|uniref:Pentatricopeptide repeat-containing protein n=1 Tax=Trifolium medium TaxID=97028 RepID=A0A392N798_9FABA|nr:pentatricopeptide repeat-containing protein [Trifolium medium]